MPKIPPKKPIKKKPAPKLCIACEGTGKRSKGGRCDPCKGTGLRK